jgi:hypothetical protein
VSEALSKGWALYDAKIWMRPKLPMVRGTLLH